MIPEAPPQGPAFDPKVFAATLSHKPGVYRMLDAGGAVIYVGKARDLKRRVASYFSGKATDAKTMAMVRVVAGIEGGISAGNLTLRMEALLDHAQRSLHDGFGSPVWSHCLCERLRWWQRTIKRLPTPER